jgi:hypothetical protein
MATGTKTLTTSMEAVDGSKLCHYPPLTHSCWSRGSSCCAVTVSPNRQNLQPLTWNDVSNSSNAWSHVQPIQRSPVNLFREWPEVAECCVPPGSCSVTTSPT